MYETRRFISAFTTARHLSLFWARSIQSTPPSHFLKNYLNIILPTTPGSSKWSLPHIFPHQKPCVPLLSPIHAICPTNHILHALITRTILGEQWGSLSSYSCSFLHSPATSSLLGPNILLYILFSNTLSLRSSLNVSGQVSHPYKTTGTIIFLYILIFIYLNSKLKDKIFCNEL